MGPTGPAVVEQVLQAVQQALQRIWVKGQPRHAGYSDLLAARDTRARPQR